MRLLFVTNLYPPISFGGYEQSCLDLATGLRRRGHEVVVLTSSLREAEVSDSRCGVHRRMKMSASWRNRPSLRLDLHNMPVVRSVIGSVQPDIVVVWNGANLGRGLLGVIEKMAVVVYYLGDTWLAPIVPPIYRHRQKGQPPLRRYIYETFARAIYRPVHTVRGENLIFVSKALRDQYERLGVDVRRSTVIPNGVSDQLFPRQMQRISTRASGEVPRILFSGRVVPDKGVGTLVMALPTVRSTRGLEDTRLSILGSIQDPSYGRWLRRLAKTLDLSDVIDFLPYLPREQLSAIYAKHDVLAFPSEWEEPFGLSLIEAMATGLPVVATPCGAPKEIIQDGVNGVMSKPRNPEDLGSKLAWLLTHPKEAAAIGQRGSADISSRYALETRIKRLESYLHMLVGAGTTDPIPA